MCVDGEIIVCVCRDRRCVERQRGVCVCARVCLCGDGGVCVRRDLGVVVEGEEGGCGAENGCALGQVETDEGRRKKLGCLGVCVCWRDRG